VNSFLIELIINILLSITAIFIVSNIFYIILIFASKKMINRQKLSWPYNNFGFKPISLIVPAYNEEKNITESLKSFLNQKYSNFEIILINDGSTDKTLEKILSLFEFKEIEFDQSQFKFCQSKIKKIYYCANKKVRIIDKENSGKADSLNAGIDFAKNEYICSVDADSILDPVAFNRIMLEFSVHPSLVACGSTIGVVNGSEVKDGKITRTKLPSTYIELCQLLEYTQSFLMGRVGWQLFNSTMIISGAFGVFKKQALKEVGGFDRYSLGEDMDLTVRLHKHFLKKDNEYSIGFIPDPLCWTEVPSDFKTLSNQRNRWQRGLLSSIFKEKVLFNTRKSFFSRFVIPYYLTTEILSPIIEIISYLLILIGLFFGFISFKILVLFFLIGLMFSTIISLTSLIYEERFFSKDMTLSQLFYLFIGSIFMNIGYRQYMVVQRFKGIMDFYLQKQGWGKMNRKGFLS